MKRPMDKDKHRVKRLFWGFICLFVFCALMIVAHAAGAFLSGTDEDGAVWVQGMPVDWAVQSTPLEQQPCVGGGEASVYVQAVNMKFDGVGKSAKLNFANIMRLLEWLGVMVAMVMGVVCAVSFYRSITRAGKFNRRYIKYLRIVGAMVMLAALFGLLAEMYASVGVGELLGESLYKPHVQLRVDASTIVFGLVLIFLSYVLDISLNLQEEQEYTI